MNQELKNKLFKLLRMIFDIDSISFEEEWMEEECNALLSFADRQAVLPIIYQSLKRLNNVTIETMLSKWKLKYSKYIYDYVRRVDALKKVEYALEKSRIPYIPLKWATIREYYPEGWMRTSRDIDILVEEKRIEEAVDALRNLTDFQQCGNRSYHDIPMRNQIDFLELHFSLKEKNTSLDACLERVWDYTVASDGYMRLLTPEYLLFYTVAHMSHHMVHGGVGMRPYLDLWLLAKNTSYDETILRNLLDAAKLMKYFEISIQMVDTWMYSLPRNREIDLLEEYCLRGGVFGDSKTVAAANQRAHKGFRYISKRLFADKELLYEEFPQLKGKQYRMPIYQVKRWARLLDKNKRKLVSNEIKSIRATNQSDIEDYNQLLQNLGL